MQEAVKQRFFPGAVLLVSLADEIVFHKAYGFANLFNYRKMTRDTIFDLASLTKPLSTTLAIMHFVQKGLLELDCPVGRYCVDLKGDEKANLTLRHLLGHCSGLPAWKPYFMRLRHLGDADRLPVLRKWLKDEPLIFSMGKRVVYSDIGFMLIQWVVEEFTGYSLADIVNRMVYAPMGVSGLYYPLTCDRHHDLALAATELCPWRNKLLVGCVHDDNAFALGGAAAHSGLFGSALSVYHLLQTLLAADKGALIHPLFDRRLIKEFFEPQAKLGRPLGFDTPDKTGSSSGKHFSAGSIGHLGFTGVSFWMDRDRSAIVILLTNRVHPSRHNTKIRDFRPTLYNAVMEAIIGI
ncbi:MAG: beta-lactamase family protein [Desulfobacteraceae bacterium]|nr:beta-lactamase family protein [Desulfobacteraceae bacterium]